MQLSFCDWTYPELELEAAPKGFVHQLVDNYSEDGMKFGTNDVAVFQHMMVVHNHYCTPGPLVKSQIISGSGQFLDIIVMSSGRNGRFTPPGNGMSIPFGLQNVMLGNFTNTLPHYLEFTGDSELNMHHAALSHEHLRELAELYPDRLESVCRYIEDINRDVIMGGYSTNRSVSSIGEGFGKFAPYSPQQLNCLYAIFGPHILGNSTGEFVTDNLITYLSTLFPGKYQPKSLKKIPYSDTLRRKIYIAREIIDANIQKPLSLIKLALEIGTNENYLKTGFRHEFGLTVFGYLFERRMLVARQMLLDTSLPIEQIASIVGYTDPVGFYTPFRKRFGLTPTQFRANKFKL